MMSSHELRQEHLLSQTISLSQKQSLEILQCSNLQLNLRLREEYIENPMLDFEPMVESKGPNLWDGSLNRNPNIDRINLFTDKSMNLRNYVIEQLQIKKYSKNQWKIFEYMIDNLDENGYYTYNIEEVAQICDCSHIEVEKCLRYLQELEPCGIFQPDLVSSLLFQISKLPYRDKQLENIIRYHLTDISERKISKITREMSISTTDVQKYIDQIGNLNLHLLANFDNHNTKYIIPDIVAVLSPNGWEVSLNDSWMGNYKIHDYYYNMIDETQDKELKRYFTMKLQRAKKLIFQIEQRRNTIIEVTKQILKVQDAFFKYNGSLQHLSLKDIAQTIDKHPSTVSRAISNKYLQTPKGTFGLKELFVRKGNYRVNIDNHKDIKENEFKNNLMNIENIKAEIKRIIENEDKNKPYSDNQIKDQLAIIGIYISRRTVSDYREQMGYWNSYNRKK